MPNPEVDVEYALFYKKDDEFLPVTSSADLAIEAGFIAADNNPRVESVDDVAAQDALLDEHCQTAFDNVAINGYTIAFGTLGYTVWVDSTKRWEPVALGGSIHYAVVGPTSPSNDPRLYWQANTKGAST
jgi:hypothetical protein